MYCGPVAGYNWYHVDNVNYLKKLWAAFWWVWGALVAAFIVGIFIMMAASNLWSSASNRKTHFTAHCPNCHSDIPAEIL
jgi:uncharacterized membrane protein